MKAEPTITEVFLASASVVVDAVGSDDVRLSWNSPSVLEEQTVGGLASHLARGGVWLVGDYLAGPAPTGPITFGSAGAYFADVAGRLTPDDHRAVRARGAELASMGHAAIATTLRDRLRELRSVLDRTAVDSPVVVLAGAVMRLGDYLRTRVVEQAVHLDDLARSTASTGWTLPECAYGIATQTAIETAVRRAGNAAVIRALYRAGCTDGVLPVL